MAISEPLEMANELIGYINERTDEMHPADAMMVLSYVREHLTAHVQCVLADAYYTELRAQRKKEDGDDR